MKKIFKKALIKFLTLTGIFIYIFAEAIAAGLFKYWPYIIVIYVILILFPDLFFVIKRHKLKRKVNSELDEQHKIE